MVTMPDLRTARGQETAIVAVAAVAAGVGAVLAGAEATGLAWWDAVLSFVVAVLVVAAASKAPRWASIVIAAIGAAGVGLSGWVIVAWGALLVALASALLLRRSRGVGALAAAMAVQVLFRLPPFGFFGLPSIVAGVAFVVVLVAGYRYSTKGTRRGARWALLIGSVLAIVVAFVGGLSLLEARTDVERGVAAAQRGLDAARSGDPGEVAAELDRAEAALGSAQSSASGPAARMLRLLPVAAQHQRAIEVATEEGAAIAREAAGAVREADLDTITLNAASVDLEALQRMGPRLRSTSDALVRGSDRISASRSGWLLPGVDRRIEELLSEVDELLPDALLAADAVEIVPDLLGASASKRYFIIFGQPAESREFGGFVGSWAVLLLDNGSLSLEDSGRIDELYGLAASNVLPDGVAPDWYAAMARPTQFPQNLTSSPDFATVAEVGQQIFRDGFDAPLDGYLYIDPHAVIDTLELTGPIDVADLDINLSPETASQFFFEDQYRFVGADRNDAFDGLAVAADAVLESLSTRTLPGPEELGRVLGPAARAGRLQVVTFDDQANDFLEQVKLYRPFEHGDTTDFLGVVGTNGTPSKLDLYLHRDVAYEVQRGPDGAITANARVELRSIVPPDTPSEVVEFTLGPAEYDGINRVLLSVYTPHSLLRATVDGVEQPIRQTSEFGLNRYIVDAPVAPDGVPVIVEYELVGLIDPEDDYSLEVWHQPLVNSDDVSITYRSADGGFSWSDVLVENVILDAEELGE